MTTRFLFLAFALFAVEPSIAKENTIPIQYKDLTLTINQLELKKVTYSPVGNGALNISLSSGNSINISFISFDTIQTLAERLSIDNDGHYELIDNLIPSKLPDEKKNIVNRVFSTYDLRALIGASTNQKKAYLLEHVDNTIELFMITPQDSSGYYSISGFSTPSSAESFIKYISID